MAFDEIKSVDNRMTDQNFANKSSQNTTNTPSNISNNEPKFKRCLIQLTPQSNEIGLSINPKIKPKHLIFSVDPLSPAYMANLRTNDIIIEINGENMRQTNFDKVRQKKNEFFDQK